MFLFPNVYLLNNLYICLIEIVLLFYCYVTTIDAILCDISCTNVHCKQDSHKLYAEFYQSLSSVFCTPFHVTKAFLYFGDSQISHLRHLDLEKVVELWVDTCEH